jgi:hypothetical protein
MELIEKKLKFIQDGDCMQQDHNVQELTVEVVDGGGGAYIVISTERWAFDDNDFDNFVKMLKNELKGVGHGIPYKLED